jgi:hypothetical protein
VLVRIEWVLVSNIRAILSISEARIDLMMFVESIFL